MDIRSDMHTHTNLSSCAPRETTLQALLDGLCAGADGVRVLGISNHLWDSDIPGASDWYKPQNAEHVLSIRKSLLTADTHGARVLVGAEVEFTADLKVCVTYEHARLFDYLIISANHVHMKGLIIPPDMTDPQEVADCLVKRFKAASKAELPVKTGIAHPFYPMSFKETEELILSLISDSTYEECFKTARDNGKSIEIHSSAFGSHLQLNSRGYCDEYVRMLGIAREVGCTFHIGSDVHTPDPSRGIKLRSLVKYLGITEHELTEF